MRERPVPLNRDELRKSKEENQRIRNEKKVLESKAVDCTKTIAKAESAAAKKIDYAKVNSVFFWIQTCDKV